MDAAGEALAAHGDGASPRREAEARMFLDSQLPAAARSQPVELVIKVEHPAEERVLEGAIAGGSAAREPVEDYAPPPPPPMPDKAITSRREAEAEIARILATVEAMPLAERETLARDEDDAIAPISELVADLDDAPVDAVYEAVEDEDTGGVPGVADEAAEAVAAELPVEEALAVEPVAETAEDVAPEDDVAATLDDTEDSAAARVAARMVQELDDNDPGEADAEAEAEPAMVADAETLVSGDTLGDLDEAGPAPEAGDALADSLEDAPVAPQPQAALSDALMADFDLSSGMDLGFVLTRSATPAPEPVPAPQPQSYSLDLPEGSTLGYAFTSVITGRFQPREDAPAPAAPELAPEAELTPEPAGEPETGADLAVAEEADAEPATATHEAEAVTEIVERAVAVAGDETPPPHPAETPAESAGAVGEVEAGARAADAAESAAVDVLTDDPLMGDDDDLLSGEDEFSPQDLAADVEPEPEKPVRKGDDGGWGFLASFAAGAVVSGFGLITTWGEWSRMWAERSLSGDAWVFIAGVFLMMVSAWFLGSVWLERLKRNGRDTA